MQFIPKMSLLGLWDYFLPVWLFLVLAAVQLAVVIHHQKMLWEAMKMSLMTRFIKINEKLR